MFAAGRHLVDHVFGVIAGERLSHRVREGPPPASEVVHEDDRPERPRAERGVIGTGTAEPVELEPDALKEHRLAFGHGAEPQHQPLPKSRSRLYEWSRG